MARINLLPWREKLRKKRQRDFLFLLIGGAVVTVVAGALSLVGINGMIDQQNARNQYLKKEIRAVDAKIREIDKLEKTKADLIARMNVIQQLQSSRPEIVHLFDELSKTIPDGVYLTNFAQKGRGLNMQGRAQSNARVSGYMRNLEGSGWLSDPKLRYIENKDKTATGLSHFELAAKQKKPKTDEDDDKGQ
jgi:type IV pilus assembly protein PilN